MAKEKISVGNALRRIKRLKGEIAEATNRAKSSVTHLVDKPPAFKFEELVEQRSNKIRELVDLQTGVATANASTKLSSGQPVIAALRDLEEIKSEIAFLNSLDVRAQPITEERERETDWDEVGGKSVVRMVDKTWVCALTEKARVTMVTNLKKRFEVLNAEVEAHNHATFIEVEPR